MFSSQKQEMDEMLSGVENQLAHERDQWNAMRQHYENMIAGLTYERDEAIRTKTLETGELRRQNNVLKDYVRELERQQATRGFDSDATDNFNSDFGSFSNLEIDDDWNEEFSLITGDDLKMEGEDTPQRQLTPRPPPTSDPKPSKQENLISMNTLYMCLLFGAFFTSTSTTFKDSALPKPSAVDSLPEDYRAEANNVLKALASTSGLDSSVTAPTTKLPTTISGHELSRMSSQASASSSLDHLAATLTTPSRSQQAAAAFSLSASSYNHITNPDGIMDSPPPSSGMDGDEETGPRQPTRLESLFRQMQASRDDVDRISGMGGKARERSVLLDRVPEKVLRDFREMVGMAEKEKRGQ